MPGPGPTPDAVSALTVSLPAGEPFSLEQEAVPGRILCRRGAAHALRRPHGHRADYGRSGLRRTETWRRSFTVRRSRICAAKSSGSMSATRLMPGTSCWPTPTRTRLRTPRTRFASSSTASSTSRPRQGLFHAADARSRRCADLATDARPGRDGGRLGRGPDRPDHARQPADSRTPAAASCSGAQQNCRARHELARLRRGQYPQHHCLADYGTGPAGAARCGPTCRRAGAVHPQLARPVWPAAQVQRGVR